MRRGSGGSAGVPPARAWPRNRAGFALAFAMSLVVALSTSVSRLSRLLRSESTRASKPSMMPSTRLLILVMQVLHLLRLTLMTSACSGPYSFLQRHQPLLGHGQLFEQGAEQRVRGGASEWPAARSSGPSSFSLGVKVVSCRTYSALLSMRRPSSWRSVSAVIRGDGVLALRHRVRDVQLHAQVIHLLLGLLDLLLLLRKSFFQRFDAALAQARGVARAGGPCRPRRWHWRSWRLPRPSR